MSKAPYIFLIDLDGTIQGDITPQLKEYVLQKSLQIKQNKHHKKLVANDYQKSLLRPFFKAFVNMIQTHYKNKVELFIYTASEKKWANYIVPIIESVTGVKFNRPIFTRDDCNMGLSDKIKSISTVKPAILKTLKKTYTNITSEQTLDRIYLIDNNYVLKEDRFLIKCPTYDKAVFINVLRSIDESLKQTKFNDICKVLINVDSCKNQWEMMKNIYDDAFKKFVYYDEKNKAYMTDRYWRKVMVIFKKNGYNMTTIIKYLKEIS